MFTLAFVAGTEKGPWQKVFMRLSEDKDLESVMIDGTYIRAHQHAAGSFFWSVIGFQRLQRFADKGYYCTGLILYLTSRDVIVVIPSLSNRKKPRNYDHYLYKQTVHCRNFFQ